MLHSLHRYHSLCTVYVYVCVCVSVCVAHFVATCGIFFFLFFIPASWQGGGTRITPPPVIFFFQIVFGSVFCSFFFGCFARIFSRFIYWHTRETKNVLRAIYPMSIFCLRRQILKHRLFHLPPFSVPFAEAPKSMLRIIGYAVNGILHFDLSLNQKRN